MVTKHAYWGAVEAGWAGFSADALYPLPQFNHAGVEIFLGDECDEDGEEIEDAPSPQQLDAFEDTFISFMADAGRVMEEIKQKTFERYQRLYAKYYEDPGESGESALGITTADKHFGYIQDVNYLRILDGNTIIIPIHYKLDEEHGLEIRLENNQVVAIGGIADT